MDAAVVDLGRARGLALLKGKRSRFRHVVADTYFVPSATGAGGYVVDLGKDTCTCPAFEDSGTYCKHLWGASFFRGGAPSPIDESIVSQSVRRTYAQGWPAYNLSQCKEKEHVQLLLRGLCDGLQITTPSMG